MSELCGNVVLGWGEEEELGVGQGGGQNLYNDVWRHD